MISRHDRHERAAPRQFHELFERCLFHDSPLPGVRETLASRASITVGGRRHARPPLELQARLRDQHLEPADRLGARRARAAAAASSPPGCRRGRRRARPHNAAAIERRRVDVRPRADRRGVDEHIPAAGGRPRAGRRRRTRAASARARSVRRALTSTGAPCARQRPDAAARAAPPAPSTTARLPAQRHRRRSSGARNPATSKLRPSQPRGPRRSVLTRADRRVSVVGRRRTARRATAFSGAVTLAPRRRMRRRDRRGTRRRRPSRAARTRRRSRAPRTRRCASPATPSARAARRSARRPRVAVVVRARDSTSISSRVDSWPGAAAPPYVHSEPSHAGHTRVS